MIDAVLAGQPGEGAEAENAQLAAN